MSDFPPEQSEIGLRFRDLLQKEKQLESLKVEARRLRTEHDALTEELRHARRDRLVCMTLLSDAADVLRERVAEMRQRGDIPGHTELVLSEIDDTISHLPPSTDA